MYKQTPLVNLSPQQGEALNLFFVW